GCSWGSWTPARRKPPRPPELRSSRITASPSNTAVSRPKVRGAVLAGGAASRYGGAPKGLLAVGGRRILDRVVTAVHAVTGAPPLLVANAPDAGSWRPDLKTIPDARQGCGSLGWIYTAVTVALEPVLCVAWDMPFVPEGLLRALIDGAANYDAFLPASSGRRVVEPLCAV